MPKSRNRKNHKKKVASRNTRLKIKRNVFNKKIQEMFAKKEVVNENLDNKEINS